MKLPPIFRGFQALGKISGFRPSPIVLQAATTKRFTVLHGNYARKAIKRYRVREGKNLQQGCQHQEYQEESHDVFDNRGDALQEQLMENAEVLENMTEEQKAFWLSKEFSSLRAEYPAITLHMEVPPEAPTANIEKYIYDMAMDLAVDIHVAAHPPDVLQTPADQTQFAETMMMLLTEHMKTIAEGLRTGWFRPVKKGNSEVSVFDS